MNHTPGPWEANNIKTDPTDLACAIWDKKGKIPICTGSFSVGKYNEVDAQTMHANMQHIVHCVNTHDALVSALSELVNELGILKEFGHLTDEHVIMDYPLRKAKEALAMAEKGV